MQGRELLNCSLSQVLFVKEQTRAPDWLHKSKQTVMSKPESILPPDWLALAPDWLYVRKQPIRSWQGSVLAPD